MLSEENGGGIVLVHESLWAGPRRGLEGCFVCRVSAWACPLERIKATQAPCLFSRSEAEKAVVRMSVEACMCSKRLPQPRGSGGCSRSKVDQVLPGVHCPPAFNLFFWIPGSLILGM